MSNPTNFKFPYQWGICINKTKFSSPIQTVSGGSDWLYYDYDDIQSLSAGIYNFGAIKTDGTLWLWGSASGGSLGNNSTTDRSSPVQTITTGTNWKQVFLGLSLTAATKTDGTLWLWGNGTVGQLGNNSTINQSSPVQTVTTGNNWKQASVDKNGTGAAAIKTDGTLWLWGRNAEGQLGTNTTAGVSSPVQTVSTGNNWRQVSFGDYRIAATKTDGTLWLWGCGALGPLGNNSTTNRSSPVQTVTTGTNWKQVSSGTSVTAAIKTDGTLWLWGSGAAGRLGNNATINRSSPVQTVSSGTNWKQVSLGSGPASAIKTDGTLWLWGDNITGALGTNNRIDYSSPVQTISTGNIWKQSSLGCTYSAAIKTDGTLWLWGLNTNGQLGTNNRIDYSSPVQTVSTGDNWTSTEECAWCSFAARQCTSAAIKSDGTLWLWGYGICGRLGNNSTAHHSSPIQTVSTGTNWKQVALGNLHSSAIKSDGTLWLWGDGNNGQLGDNTLSSKSSPVQTVTQGNDWKQVALGTGLSAAIKTDGTLWLWGCGGQGQLGNNSTTNRSSPVQTISTGNNWKQVSLGLQNTAAIKTDGTLWTWGSASNAVLGNNSTTNRSSPVQTISQGTNWKQVSLSSGHASAIKTDGTLWLWGLGSCGRLGNSATTIRSSPVQTVSTGNNWKQVSLGAEHSSAVKTDGTLWLWGRNVCGQLGNNSTIDHSSPVQTVSQGNYWNQVPSSQGTSHSLALDYANSLDVWGDNSFGQLGCDLAVGDFVKIQYDFDETFVRRDLFSEGGLFGWGTGANGALGDNSTISKSSPVQTISGGTNWSQVSSSSFFPTNSGIKTDGTLWLWGINTQAQLGNNSTIDHSSPVQTVSSGTNWKQVSLGGSQHSAAIKTDGTLWLWGDNSCGKLGNNSTVSSQSPVQTVSTGANWYQVSAGHSTAASIKTDGTLWLWGDNSCGTLGTDSIINQSSPVQTVSTGTNWKQVSGGYLTSAAIKTDGTLWLWGIGSNGRLGNNSSINRSSPVQTISTGTNWKQVSITGFHSAAIKTDGTLWLWGPGDCGVLGNNSTISTNSPVQTISTGTNWKQVTLGWCRSAAIKTDGTLWLWGENSCGALGDNSTINKSSPVQSLVQGNNWKDISTGYYLTTGIREDCW